MSRPSLLPNFLVIGAQKSATSNLCDLIVQHPEVFVTDPKEPYFFSHDEVWARGMAWYESLFEGADGCAAIGEGSTTYSQHHLYPEAADRIARQLPDTRLIFMARHPLERIQSHWMHLRSRENREPLPFDEAVRTRPGYVDHSRYDHQLGFYRAHFDEGRMLVLFFEDFCSDPAQAARQCYDFLGVDPDFEAAEREEARHESSLGRVDSSAMSAMRRFPLFRHIRGAAPTPVRDALRKVLKKPIGDRPEWKPETRDWVLSQLRDDSAAFLERYGKPRDYWSFD